jgi:hypothetical protein
MPSALDLNFKKEKPRPNTDRAGSLSGSDLKNNANSDALSLIEKKKQYSMALR